MPSVFHRRLFRSALFLALCAALVASLAACSGMASQSAPERKTQFAAGWSEHSRALLFQGMARDPGTNVWLVPRILPRGTYRVIERHSDPAGDTAELLDGYRIEVDSPEKEIYLRIPAGNNNLEALEEKYIVGLDGAPLK